MLACVYTCLYMDMGIWRQKKQTPTNSVTGDVNSGDFSLYIPYLYTAWILNFVELCIMFVIRNV